MKKTAKKPGPKKSSANAKATSKAKTAKTAKTKKTAKSAKAAKTAKTAKTKAGKPKAANPRAKVAKKASAGMFGGTAKTVAEYLASLAPETRASIERVRDVILKNLPAGYEEGIAWGTITYSVPLSRYSNTYNGQPLCIAALAAHRSKSSVYLMGVYGHAPLRVWFEEEYRKSGKKLDMGKSCVRFKSADDLPLDLIGATIAKVGVDEYLRRYEETRAKAAKGR